MARNFASDSPPQTITLPSGAQVLDLSAYAFICLFRVDSAANYRYITAQEANFNEQMFIRLNTDGTVNFWHRTPSAIVNITSGGSYDDGNWHWILFLRRGSADFQAYIDGSSVGTSTSNPGTISVSPTVVLGNYASGDEPTRGDLARCILIPAAVEVDEARGIAYTGITRRPVRFWHELIDPSSAPDWSGNGYNGTIVGATLANHAPVALPLFNLQPSIYVPESSGVVTGSGQSDIVFGDSAAPAVRRERTGQADVVFGESAAPAVVRARSGQSDMTFGSSAAPVIVRARSGQSDSVFGSTATGAVRRERSGQADGIFDSTATPAVTRPRSGQSDMTFGSSAAPAVRRERSGQSAMVFDSSATGVLNGAITGSGQSDMVFDGSAAPAVQRDRSGQSAMVMGAAAVPSVTRSRSGQSDMTFGSSATPVVVSGSAIIGSGQSGVVFGSGAIPAVRRARSGQATLVFGSSAQRAMTLRRSGQSDMVFASTALAVVDSGELVGQGWTDWIGNYTRTESPADPSTITPGGIDITPAEPTGSGWSSGVLRWLRTRR